MWSASYWDEKYQGRGNHPGLEQIALGVEVNPHTYNFRQRDELYRRIMPRGAGRSILEIGAAPGEWLVYFYWELGLRPVGIDFAASGVAVARRKLAHFGVPGEVICADFMKHDFGTRRFDVVFFQGSLEHFPDPLPPLRRALDLCQPGGLLCAQIPYFPRGNVNSYLGSWLGRKAMSEHYLRDGRDMRRVFAGIGLDHVELARIGTFEIVLEADNDLGPLGRRMVKLLGGLSGASQVMLNCLDLRRQSDRFSPYLLAYASVPGPAPA